jgi:hypothetical protein
MEMFTLIVIWLALIFATGALADRRGYNPATGAVMGALFGVFALLVYACMKDNKEKVSD